MAMPPKPAPTTNRSIWSTGPRGVSIMLDSMPRLVHGRGPHRDDRPSASPARSGLPGGRPVVSAGRSGPGRQGEDLVPVLGDDDGVLELGGPRLVRGGDGPVVVPDVETRSAEGDHRLDGQRHTGLEDLGPGRLVVMQDDEPVVE